MECNKDEAAKSKELAEKKFQEKDIMSARKLALKAQRLYPSLVGIPDLLATLNIYVSSERKINGEVDWYGVLGVEPSSDEDTVKKQYRKLALTLHPDKNKSAGAEGAFKILSEAWSVLSDKVRRGAYDQKRSSRGIYTKVTPSNPLKPNGNNGNFCNKTTNYPNPHSAPFAPPPQRNTFWTMCMGCKMQFEYALLYLNKKLECYNCKVSYVAKEIPPPQLNPQASYSSHVPQHSSRNPTERKMFCGPAGNPGVQTVNGIQVPRGNTNIMHEAARVSATMEDTMKGRTNPALKRANTGETNIAARGEKPKRRRRTNEQIMNDNRAEKSSQFQKAGFGSSNGFHNRPFSETEKTSILSKWTASTRELSLLETRNMLMAKAKSEICKKLSEWNNMSSTQASKLKESRKAKERVSINNVVKSDDANGVDQNLDRSLPRTSSGDSETQPSEPSTFSMSVPDPDFHDFDKDRTVNSFGDNEVWAAYDDDDGMPRYYAMIQNVISRNPFKMRMSWLNSKSNAEFGSLNWVSCGFYKTSGNFRVGRYKINQSINSFSHRVKWAKGEKGAIRLYPQKGDVWALYKNWSPEWDENTPDDVIHQYDMVEVLDEFSEEKGIIVIPLVKVAGFKTVFRQHVDKNQAKVIPKEEMFRFSHQVPSYLLTGQESPSSPEGCLELDPAAIPMELLQVIPETENPQKKTT